MLFAPIEVHDTRHSGLAEAPRASGIKQIAKDAQTARDAPQAAYNDQRVFEADIKRGRAQTIAGLPPRRCNKFLKSA